jgi:hypothetical protein
MDYKHECYDLEKLLLADDEFPLPFGGTMQKLYVRTYKYALTPVSDL